MTAIPEPTRITSVSGLVAACAPMLGFVPDHSVVGFIHGVPGREGAVLVRIDLGDDSTAGEVAQALALSIAGTGGFAVDLVVWVDAPDSAAWHALPGGLLVAALRQQLAELEVEVLECVTTNGRTYWWPPCGDPWCCPPDGQALDEQEMTAIRAEFVYAGKAPLASREELLSTVARDPQRSQAVAAVLRNDRRPASSERWRDRRIRHISTLLVPPVAPRLGAAARPALDARQVARVVQGLDDIRVRDTVLLRLIRAVPEATAEPRDLIDRWIEVVTAAPARRAAPAATILAVLAWWQGEGALASCALERAFDDDPDYRLAHLAAEIMTRGIDPSSWRESMAQLSEAQCRGWQGLDGG